jgi:hypothetical protein
MNEYYYTAENTVLGPLSVAELGLAMRQGELPRDTQVSRDAGSTWMALPDMLVDEGWPAPIPEPEPVPAPAPAPEMKTVPLLPARADKAAAPTAVWADVRGLLSVWLGLPALVLGCMPVFGMAAAVPGLAGLFLGTSIYRQCRVFALIGIWINGMALLAALLQGAAVSFLARALSR